MIYILFLVLQANNIWHNLAQDRFWNKMVEISYVYM